MNGRYIVTIFFFTDLFFSWVIINNNDKTDYRNNHLISRYNIKSIQFHETLNKSAFKMKSKHSFCTALIHPLK